MKFDTIQLCDIDIEVIDGDRGKNYPHQDELLKTGDCLFLSAKNVTKNGFSFTEKQFITKEKDKLLNNGRLKHGDIVITTRGTVGNVALYSNEIFYDKIRINSGMLIIRCGDKIDNYYLYQVLRSKWFQNQILSIQSGSAQPQLPKSHFHRMTIPVPDVNTQHRIASILSSIDEKIVVNTAINENLEQQAQAIFKSWFVDFEPFGGVMPDDWCLGTFSDIIESTLGGDWGKETSTGNYTERVYCIRGADIPEVKAGNKGKMPTRYILPKNFKNKKLIANDIVVEISGGSPTQSTGRVAAISQSLLDRYDCGMVCTNFCRAIKPCEGYSYYTYYYWQYLYDRNVFFSYENGTTGIKNLDLSGFVETESIIIPSNKAIQEFNSLIDSFHSRIFKNGQENENIAALRDTLLPKLMNGEIDVSKVRI